MSIRDVYGSAGLEWPEHVEASVSLLPFADEDYQRWRYVYKEMASAHYGARLNAGGPTLEQMRAKRIDYYYSEFELISFSNQKGCGDKVEKAIYSVVEWIPGLSSLWDAFSASIYTITGCSSVAQERAMSLALNGLMDVASAVTFGAAKPVAYMAKGTVKSISKQGVKMTWDLALTHVKTTVGNSVAKASIKRLSTSAITASMQKGVIKSGSFVFKAAVMDNVNVVKSLVRMSYKGIRHPVRSMASLGKSLKSSYDDIIQLKGLDPKDLSFWKSGDVIAPVVSQLLSYLFLSKSIC